MLGLLLRIIAVPLAWAQQDPPNNTLPSVDLERYRRIFANSSTSGGGALFVDFAVKTANLVLRFISLAAVLMIIYGGIVMMTGAVDEGAQENGKTIIKFAVIGLVLSLLAQAIIVFLLTFAQDLF